MNSTLFEIEEGAGPNGEDKYTALVPLEEILFAVLTGKHAGKEIPEDGRKLMGMIVVNMLERDEDWALAHETKIVLRERWPDMFPKS